MKLFFVLIVVGFVISQTPRAGLPTRTVPEIYTRGSNSFYEGGYSLSNQPILVERKFISSYANFIPRTTNNIRFKLMCSTLNEMIAVTTDDYIGIIGYCDICPGYQGTSRADFWEIDAPSFLESGETIVDLQCSDNLFIFQTSNGGLYGMGENSHRYLNASLTTGDFIEYFSNILTGSMTGKLVRTFAIGSHNTYGALSVVTTTGEVHYRGRQYGGNCMSTTTEDDFILCSNGLFDHETEGDLDIVTIGGGYSGMFYIRENGEVLYTGDVDFSGNGENTLHRTSPVVLDFDNLNFQGQTSGLAGKTVKDIRCSARAPVCMALTTDGGVYTWTSHEETLQTALDLLGRDSTVPFANKVARAVDTSQCGIFGAQQIAFGEERCCYVCSNQRVFCWGRNNYHGINNSTTTSINVPTETVIHPRSSTYKWLASGFGVTMYVFSGCGIVYVNVLLLIFIIFALF